VSEWNTFEFMDRAWIEALAAAGVEVKEASNAQA
jgi:hypothetical protein